MQFKTLEHLNIEDLATLFNCAFADYFVKIELTPEILLEKIETEDIDMQLSVGTFDKNKPVGFIFHGVRGKAAYNAGTGVIPEFRGNKLTVKMYEFILPKLKNSGIHSIELEVIEKNKQAIKSYEKVGFQIASDLLCFKGHVNSSEPNKHVKIREIKQADFQLLKSFCNWQPTWQHASETVKKSYSYKIFGAFKKEELQGYLIGNVKTARVAQFAVHPDFRRKKIGSSLFRYFSELTGKELSVINVNDHTQQTKKFLENLGLKHFLTQKKMIKSIN